MKIYFLRHEKRGDSCSFFSPLTLEGKKDAKLLVDTLPEFDEVWSSPYKRCIDTIYPYCLSKNLDLNIENGLAEYHHNHELKNSKDITIANYKESLLEMDLIHDRSCINNKEIVDNFPETNERVYRRIAVFLDKHINEWRRKNKDVLICSHLHCYYLLRYYFEVYNDAKDVVMFDCTPLKDVVNFDNPPMMGEFRLLIEE
jgi:broad specificity phosphatase PhoE